MARVAFQGEPGAFSEAAAIAYFGRGAITVPNDSFDGVFRRVERGDCSHGIVPIENSLAGSIHQNYDLLLTHHLSIVGEATHRVIHCLLSLPGTNLKDVRQVLSHPQGLAQCERFLSRLRGVKRVPSYDTAGSAKMVRDQGIHDGAAIASERAGKLYGLQILKRGIEDDRQNFTRFLVLSRAAVHPKGNAKTSIVFALKNVPGALFRSLSVFALRDIDLAKIESRPLKGKPWEYFFYLDFLGSLQEERCRKAIDHLREIASYLKILGSYPRAKA